jgi:hypothetical protein
MKMEKYMNIENTISKKCKNEFIPGQNKKVTLIPCDTELKVVGCECMCVKNCINAHAL